MLGMHCGHWLWFQEDACEVVLEAFVSHLVLEKQTSLIAFYVSKLKPSVRVESYAAFLEGVTDPEQRRECLENAARCRLDVCAVTKRVVERIRHKETTEIELEPTPGGADIKPVTSLSNNNSEPE